jgi:hypothetical protein
MSDTPRTDALGSSLAKITNLPAYGPVFDFARELERELAETKDQLTDWRVAGMKIGAKLLSAGSKKDGIVDGVADLIEQRDALLEALPIAMARAYASGYQRGHEETVEAIFSPIHYTDYKDFFVDDVRQMIIDGSQPEAAAAIALAKGGAQ